MRRDSRAIFVSNDLAIFVDARDASCCRFLTLRAQHRRDDASDGQAFGLISQRNVTHDALRAPLGAFFSANSTKSATAVASRLP